MKKNRLIWVVVILGLTIAVVLYIKSKHKSEVDDTLANLQTDDTPNPCEKQCEDTKLKISSFLGLPGVAVVRNCRQCLKHNNLL